MGAAFGSAGERCMAVSVALAVGKVGDALIPRLKEKMARLKVGPGTDPDAEMGPLVTKQHYDKVRGYVDLGVKEGAELAVDGRGLKLQGYEKGHFLGPCCSTRSRRRCASTRRRSSGRCCRWCASPISRPA